MATIVEIMGIFLGFSFESIILSLVFDLWIVGLPLHTLNGRIALQLTRMYNIILCMYRSIERAFLKMSSVTHTDMDMRV
jgi:hypothetical protein